MNPDLQNKNNSDTLAPIFQNFADFDLQKCDIALYLGADLQNNNGLSFAEVPLSRKLAGQFRSFISDFQHEKMTQVQNNNVPLQQFDFEAGSDGEIEYETCEQAPDVAQILIDLQKSPHPEAFTASDTDFIRKLKFAIFCCATPNQKPIYFLQKYSTRNIMKKKLSLYRLLNDEYDLLQSPILQFDEVIHTVIWENHILIFDHSVYMNVFRNGIHTRSIAQQTLENIKELDIFEQFDEFANSCQKDSRRLTKLYTISKKNRLDTISSLDSQTIQTIIRKYQLNICVVAHNGRWRLQYQNKWIWQTLKLLADDYAISEISGNRYELYGKRNIP